MKNSHFFLVLFLAVSTSSAQQIQVRDGWYYIDGEKFFIKGIGYETHTRPGQVPWVYRLDSTLIRFDMNRIKDAGFNTIRTWNALSEEELRIIEGFGIKILFGIWINPDGDFGSPSFKHDALKQVSDVLKYSVKFKSIIAYLIMNEPLAGHIYDVGAQNLSDLWSALTDLIHMNHPGIPVTFANTMVGDYINMQVFDMAAYNAYMYAPVTISTSHGYTGFLRFLKENRAGTIPMVVTEFGLSVSPPPSGNGYGYGGNTLEQQSNGDLLMYRGLIDAGTQGGCVFQYTDGWFKAGNEYSHENAAEEWFGLIEFSDLKDRHGTPRPAWDAFKRYNKAVITEPKNGRIYSADVPIELFTGDDVSAYTITRDGRELTNENISGRHHTSRLVLSEPVNVKDIELLFSFFNRNHEIIKNETITFLYAQNAPALPTINLQVTPSPLSPGMVHHVDLQVRTNPLFSVVYDRIDIVAHTHVGFDPGVARNRVMDFTNNEWSHRESFSIPTDSKVTTFAAGFTVQYGKFTTRIDQQKIVLDGDWADPIAARELVTGIQSPKESLLKNPGRTILYPCYPNPFNLHTILRFSLPGRGKVKLQFYNLLGNEVDQFFKEFYSGGVQEIQWHSRALTSGVYFYRLTFENESFAGKFIIVK
jgi:hypothetical protein